ncbi:hypothetical protein [Seongchinamella unica]|uniref:hypothetical protein n=1 Tax=Seongchinamella unica TaxID=2547392 RepID=UPI0014050C60|nr:hypothetical protein [Seongchinamella unica]
MKQETVPWGKRESSSLDSQPESHWIPAFAGMTVMVTATTDPHHSPFRGDDGHRDCNN